MVETDRRGVGRGGRAAPHQVERGAAALLRGAEASSLWRHCRRPHRLCRDFRGRLDPPGRDHRGARQGVESPAYEDLGPWSLVLGPKWILLTSPSRKICSKSRRFRGFFL